MFLVFKKMNYKYFHLDDSGSESLCVNLSVDKYEENGESFLLSITHREYSFCLQLKSWFHLKSFSILAGGEFPNECCLQSVDGELILKFRFDGDSVFLSYYFENDSPPFAPMKAEIKDLELKNRIHFEDWILSNIPLPNS